MQQKVYQSHRETNKWLCFDYHEKNFVFESVFGIRYEMKKK